MHVSNLDPASCRVAPFGSVRFLVMGVALAIAGLVACDAGGGAPGDRESTAGIATGATLDAVQFDTIAIVGALDAPEEEVFGDISEVAVGPSGRVAILDGRGIALSVFDSDGEFVAAVRDRGEGPGELGGPRNLVWTEADGVLVQDPSNGRISAFELQDGELAWEGSRPAAVFGTGNMCALGDRLFVSAQRDERFLHEVDAAGEIIRSHSPPPELEEIRGLTGMVRQIALEDLAATRLYCDSDGDRIVEVGMTNPRVQLLDADGALIWSTELTDLSTFVVEVVDGAGVGIRIDDDTGAHLARSIVPWSRDQVLIQYELRRNEASPEDQEFHRLESRLIDLETGEEVDRTDHLPLILAADGDRLVHVRQEPFPTFMILERVRSEVAR